MEYHSHAPTAKDSIEVFVSQKLADPARINITMAEFIEMISEGGKVVDLRSLQK